MRNNFALNIVFTSLMILFISWICSYSYVDKHYLHFVYLTLGTLSVLFFTSHFIWKIQLSLLLFSFSTLIFCIELIVNLGILTDNLNKKRFEPVQKFTFDKLPFYGKQSISYDSILGYQWSSSNVYVKKEAMETLVFENVFKGNNYGMHSNKDYFPIKQNAHVKRWIVFGDSFTDAYFLKKNWVDVLDSLFHLADDSIELYSFSINGGGIKNWLQIYQQLIRLEFEFDGIAFAIFGNDLARDYFAMNQIEDKTLQKYYDTIPSCSTVISDTKSIYADESPNIIHAKIAKHFYTSRLLNYLYRRYLEIKHYYSYKKSTEDLITKYISPTKSKIDETYFKNKYGDNYFLLSGLLDSIKQSGKSIMLISIPDEYGLLINKGGEKTSVQQELEWLSNRYGTKYIDGYKLLLESDEQKELSNWFIPLDGHWNQTASDSFAMGIYRNYKSLLK